MHGIFGDLFGSLTGFFDESGIAIVGGVGVFITILALGRAFVAHDPMAARLKSHQERRQHLLQEILTGDKQHKAAKQASVNLMRQLVEKLKLTRGDDARKTVDKLAQAGWRSRDQLILFLGTRLVLPFVAGGGALLFLAYAGSEISFASWYSPITGAPPMPMPLPL